MKEKYSMNHWSSATTESVEKNLLIGVNCVIVIYGEFVLGSLCASFYILFFSNLSNASKIKCETEGD